jgi:hypothetical protein
VTRDPAGSPEAGDAWGPLDPPRPRLAASRFPLGLPPPPGEAGSVPGYEFEGRRSAPGWADSPPAGWADSPPPGGDNGRADPVDASPAGPGRGSRGRPRPRPDEAPGESRRFRYTATVGQSPSGPPPAWTHDREPATPGFEFDGRALDAGLLGSDPFNPDPHAIPVFDRVPRAGNRAASSLWDDEYAPASHGRGSPGEVRPNLADLYKTRFLDSEPDQAAPPRAPRRHAASAPTRGHRGNGGHSEPVDPAEPAGAEWARLLRSLLPQPAKRNWSKRFLAELHFSGWVTRAAIPILAMIVFGVAVVVIVGANGGGAGPAPATALGFPPATLAGQEFTAAASGRGISQTLGQVASDGNEFVAVGSQSGARIGRAQFFVSQNDGRSWTMGSVRTPDGGEPPPGHAARFVAGGQGAWVAVGPGSIWMSPDGRNWTLTPSPGMPLQPGDQLSVLRRTASGFIAVGTNVPGGDQAKSSPVVFLSGNGINWQRLGASQLRLPAGTGRVQNIRYAATEGSLILIAGDVTTTKAVGHGLRTVTSQTSGAWLSRDGGATWVAAGVPPARPAAQPLIAGVAAVKGGFVLLRPATGARPGLDIYNSPNGTAWTFRATLTTPAGLVAGPVDGGPSGAVVVGQAGPTLTAFVSADGVSWRQTQAFGAAGAESVSGVAMAGGDAVVTATTTGPQSREPAITVVAAGASARQVDVAKIPGAFDPQLAVNAIAADNGGTQVAVGGANGYPAAWVSADGGSSWTPAAGATQAVFDRPGVQQLTGVTHGPAGWLAVGGVIAGTAQHPVVLASTAGRSWQAADGEAAFGGPGLVTEQAAAGPGGYVIVGYQDVAATGSSPNRTIAAAWWSAGLTGWERAGDAAAGALEGGAGSAGSGAGEQMLAVVARSGGFVAVGSDGNQASAWVSPDGRTWRQANLPVPVGSASAVLQHVASSGRTVVATGTAVTTTGQRLPFAASSANGGATWTEAALPVPAGVATVTALAAAGGSFTATGTFGRTPGHQDVVVWTSANGSAWTAATPTGQGLTGPGIQAITSLALSGSTLTGVGYTASPAGEEPVFWQSPVR